MFEWSKEICKKIKDSNCLDSSELQMVEMSLRIWESFENILDESIVLSDTNLFELEHAVYRNRKKGVD